MTVIVIVFVSLGVEIWCNGLCCVLHGHGHPAYPDPCYENGILAVRNTSEDDLRCGMGHLVSTSLDASKSYEDNVF